MNFLTLSDRHVKALEELGFKFEAKEKRVALKNRPHHMALANHFRRLATFSDYLDGES